MQQRKHVVFIAYPFPPMRSVACIRTGSVAKYLARDREWRVTVVTAAHSRTGLADEAKTVDERFAELGVKVVRLGRHWPRIYTAPPDPWLQTDRSTG